MELTKSANVIRNVFIVLGFIGAMNEYECWLLGMGPYIYMKMKSK